MDGRVQIWQRIHVTLNYWLLPPPPPPHWKLFYKPSSKNIYPVFFVTHINGTISLKKLQSQIIHCNLPFEDPNASNWAFMTYKLYLPLSLFLFFLFPLWRLFFFLPATLRSDIEPLPVGVLSCLTPVHIFRCPPLLPPSLPPPQTMSFWLNTLSELLFCLLLF